MDYAFALLGLTKFDVTNLKVVTVPEEKRSFGYVKNAAKIQEAIIHNQEVEFCIRELERLNKIQPEFSTEKFNVYHPDVRDSVEVAFEVGLIKYYRFKSEFRLPVGRYKYHYKYLQLNALRISPERLIIEADDALNWINGTRKKVDIVKCAQIIEGIKTMAALPFDPELARKLAAVSFFTDEEDLSTYDEEYGEKKIKFWKENNFNDFFLTMPVEEFLNLKGISITSLEEYLETAQQILQDLTDAHPKS